MIVWVQANTNNFTATMDWNLNVFFLCVCTLFPIFKSTFNFNLKNINNREIFKGFAHCSCRFICIKNTRNPNLVDNKTDHNFFNF